MSDLTSSLQHRQLDQRVVRREECEGRGAIISPIPTYKERQIAFDRQGQAATPRVRERGRKSYRGI